MAKTAPEGLLTIESKLNGIDCKLVVESINIRRGNHFTLYGFLYFKQVVNEEKEEYEWLSIGPAKKEVSGPKMKQYGWTGGVRQ